MDVPWLMYSWVHFSFQSHCHIVTFSEAPSHRVAIHCHLVTKWRKTWMNPRRVRVLFLLFFLFVFSFNKLFQHEARTQNNFEDKYVNYVNNTDVWHFWINRASLQLLAFIRALMDLPLISSSRSSSCLMERWHMVDGLWSDSAVAMGAVTFVSCAGVFSTFVVPDEKSCSHFCLCH